MSEPYYSDDSVQLFLGDCLEIDTWLAADVLVTDPPYGIPGGRVSWHRNKPTHADAVWDSVAIRDEALALWGNRPRAVFGSPKSAITPGHRGVPLVWDKGESPGIGDHSWPFGTSYELIWISGDGWNGRRRPSVIRDPTCLSNPFGLVAQMGHPTPKPVGLMSLLIQYAPPGVIADPFAGSGSTLVAAKALGRKAIGVELEERYAEIAANRLRQDVLDFGNAS